MMRIGVCIFVVVTAIIPVKIVFAGPQPLQTPEVLENGTTVLLFLLAMFLVLLVFVVSYFLRRFLAARLALRVTTVLLFVAAIVAFPLFAIASNSSLKTGISQALIAATVVASGWLVTFLVQEYREESERQRRRIDVQRAVRTEIELHYRDVEDTDWNGLKSRMDADFTNDKAYRPFIPRRERDRYFSVVIDSIDLLSDTQIVDVMRYYELVGRLELMNADLRSENYEEMGTDRKKAMALRFLALEETAAKYAHAAIRSLSNESYFRSFLANKKVSEPNKKGPGQ